MFFPDGRKHEFVQGVSTTFNGSNAILHTPESGRGERIYQTGPGDNTYILLLPDGSRQVFERVTRPEGVLYYPRYAEDAGGRRHTYTTDTKTRIIAVTDSAGNGISLQYGSVHLNRQSLVELKKVTTTPSTGWNEYTTSNPVPFRWLQCNSSDSSYFSIAEIEFYGPDGNGREVKLSGTVYGTSPGSNTSTFEKAYDGNTTTGYLAARKNAGVSGIDLGVGNASTVSKIRFKPFTGSGSDSMSALNNTCFYGVLEAPEIIEVLQSVTSTDGRVVNYLYDTIVDQSIGQSHLVLSGVDYDGDNLADSPTDARFTYLLRADLISYAVT